MIEELRPPPPYAPLNQHSPWREWENKKALEDGSRYRKKYDENTTERQTILKYTPRYHDNKFTNDENVDVHGFRSRMSFQPASLSSRLESSVLSRPLPAPICNFSAMSNG